MSCDLKKNPKYAEVSDRLDRILADPHREAILDAMYSTMQSQTFREPGNIEQLVRGVRVLLGIVWGVLAGLAVMYIADSFSETPHYYIMIVGQVIGYYVARKFSVKVICLWIALTSVFVWFLPEIVPWFQDG